MSKARKFNDTITRDRAAADYFSSGAFIQNATDAIQNAIVKNKRACLLLTSRHTGIVAAEKDMSYVQGAFQTLQEKFPDLNHVRYNAGAILFETRPQTLGNKVEHFFRRNSLIPAY